MNIHRPSATAQHIIDRRVATVLLLLAACYLVLIHRAALHGQLLSDSLSLLRSCHLQAEAGTLWSWLLHLWVDGLPVPSHYYRPLSSASLCLDYLLFGDNALAWHSMQLLLHAVNALLLLAVARMMSQGLPWQNAASSLAVLMFCLSPAAPEVSIWIAGRYNVLALMFMLAAILLHGHGRYYWSAVVMSLALASKESALVLPVLLATISWWRHVLEAAAAPVLAARLRRCARELWLAGIIVMAYLALRWHLFGDPLSVYADTKTVSADIGWHWLLRMPVLMDILLPAWRDHASLAWVFLFSLLAAAVMGLWHLFSMPARKGMVIRLWGLPALWLLLALLALLPHVTVASPAGQGSRLMYNAGAWLALLLALPWATGWKPGVSKGGGRCIRACRVGHLAATVMAMLMLAWGQYPAQRDWTRATHYVSSLRVQLASKAQSMPPGEWALVLVPDHLGMALVARNAQGALVTPPMQTQYYLDRIIPFLYADVRHWFKQLQSGARDWPDAAYCAHPQTAALVPVQLPVDRASLSAWEQAWEQAISQPPCLGIDQLQTKVFPSP